MRDAFQVAWRGLWRGKTFWTLLAAVVAVHLLLPGLVRSDGTFAGRFEMHVRIVFGAVTALVCTASLALACGALAREREDDLLPLSLVRPVSAFSLAAGRWLAFLLLAVCLLALHFLLLHFRLPSVGLTPENCRIHHVPALPPAEVAAARMMEEFLRSDKTPEEVKKAPRAAVLALLTAKENERYEVVRSGETLRLPFPVPASERLTVQVRFSTLYSNKELLCGVFSYRDCEGPVSNSTQAILEVPLRKLPIDYYVGADLLTKPISPDLIFKNTGRTDVMLRPRRDVVLLAPGDSFAANHLRATLEVLALAGLLAAFGLFLSASLSRPVALFTAAVLLAAALMAPDAVSQFPDEFNATTGEKMGLAISRAVTRFTAALSEVSPVSDLASGRAIPVRELGHAAATDLVAWPLLFLALTAFLLRRKPR